MRKLATVSILVRDYDEAIRWYTEVLGFELVEDTSIGEGRRWVRVAARGGAGASLLLSRAVRPEEVAAIGDQCGGRVFLFLETSDFDPDYLAMKSRGVRFEEEPRREIYGRVVVFRDFLGNRWDLVQND